MNAFADGGTRMNRSLILAAIAAFAVVVLPTIASAKETCSYRAQRCVANGGTHSSCFADHRMQQCRVSKVYTAPNGNRWPAPGG